MVWHSIGSRKNKPKQPHRDWTNQKDSKIWSCKYFTSLSYWEYYGKRRKSAGKTGLDSRGGLAEGQRLMLKTNTCTGTPTLSCRCKGMDHFGKFCTPLTYKVWHVTQIWAVRTQELSHSKPAAQRLAGAQQSWPQHRSIRRSDLLQVWALPVSSQKMSVLSEKVT